MSSRIGEIESKIIKELKQDPLNVYCKTFEVFDGNTTVEDMRALHGKLPACLVSYVGDTFQEVTYGSTYMVNIDISVMVISKNMRDVGQEKGVHTMLNDVKNILHLSYLKGYLDLPIILKGRSPIENAQEVSIYALLFELQIQD